MAVRPIDPAMLRGVYVITPHEAIVGKTIFYDRERRVLQPNLVFLDRAGSILFEINEVGLKGDPLDPQRKLVVVWGDSVVFGWGRSWPCLLDALAPGYQFLNGGLDGDFYTNVLRRAGEFNGHHNVNLNLLMLGWHPFVPLWSAPSSRRWRWSTLEKRRKSETAGPQAGNQNLRADLTHFLERTPNTVVLTMPTALNRRIVDCDLSSYLVAGDDDTGFRFLGTFPHEDERSAARGAAAGRVQRQGFDYIIERNEITREVCNRLGIRLIDLFAAFDTEKLADFRENFADMIHFRPRAYPLVAQLIYEGIKDLLV